MKQTKDKAGQIRRIREEQMEPWGMDGGTRKTKTKTNFI